VSKVGENGRDVWAASRGSGKYTGSKLSLERAPTGFRVVENDICNV
jgi:hypothetical protein